MSDHFDNSPPGRWTYTPLAKTREYKTFPPIAAERAKSAKMWRDLRRDASPAVARRVWRIQQDVIRENAEKIADLIFTGSGTLPNSLSEMFE